MSAARPDGPDEDPRPPSSRAPGVVVEIEDFTGRLTPEGREAVGSWARAATNLAAPQGGEVRVRLVGDAAMSEAHARYLGNPDATDVITFDLSEGASAGGAPLDTDLLICIDEARREATRRGHDLERELTLYILHGVLHCLGFDDSTPDMCDAMHVREDEILRAIGLGNTFGAPPRAAE